MLTVRLFNTLTRSIEPLAPLVAGQVRMYCCGPTVYDYQHIGNLRTYIFEDILARVIRYAGYSLQHVMNITDVGHLVSDADEGEDKMAVAMRREKKNSSDIAEYYTQIFFDHCALLNIKRPDIVCKATEHINEMIELIKRLEENGVAYQAGGNVYFDVSRFPEYGKLALLNLESLQAGATIEVDSGKRNPFDFALWFTKSKFENQEMQWDSPWGRGYPGWHIECSAMAMKHLGEEFDIHCGGIDHIPVHHTNEIAQSQGATHKCPARIWMHGNFLVIAPKEGDEAKKMSKSTGGFLTLDLLKDQKIDPLAYRLFCFTSTYRSELAFSLQAVESAAQTLKKIRRGVLELKSKAAPALEFGDDAQALLKAFEDAITEDLSMPRAMAAFHETLGSNVSPDEKLGLLYRFDSVFGFGFENWVAEEMPADIIALADQRLEARRARDWAESDRLRDALADAGWNVEDQRDSYRLKRR